MVDYNCMELIFFLVIHHVARIRRIRCHLGCPPPPSMDSLPPDKIPHGKSSPSMGFLPPPSQFCHGISSGGGGGLAIWYYSPLGKFCYGFSSGESLPYDIPSWGTFAIWYNFRGDNLPWYLFPYHEICVWGGGGRFITEGKLYHMVLFPPGEVLSWDFFRVKVMRV